MQADALTIQADALTIQADALTMQADALTMQADALTIQANALTMQADALTKRPTYSLPLQGIAKFNSLRIKEMLYLVPFDYFQSRVRPILPKKHRPAILDYGSRDGWEGVQHEGGFPVKTESAQAKTGSFQQ